MNVVERQDLWFIRSGSPWSVVYKRGVLIISMGIEKPSILPEGGSTKSWGHGLQLSRMKRIVDVFVSTLDVFFYSTTCSFLLDTTTL